VREDLTRSKVLDAVRHALATLGAASYVRHRIAERAGALVRNAAQELEERTARLARVEERVRGLILMQAEGDRSAMVAELRADLEAQADQERAAIAELRGLAGAPIRLPPADVVTQRVLELRALADSSNIQGARAALRRYFKDGHITLTPEAGSYVARGEFLPLMLLTDKAATPSDEGGRCPRWVARGGFEPPTFGL
jgi:hypothetical protein